MRNSIITLLLSIAVATMANAGEWIRINQLGYLPHATKVAVFISNDPATVDGFELVDAFTGKVAYQSHQVRATAPLLHHQYTCRLNYSDFKRQGSYFIRVGKTTSPIFAINASGPIPVPDIPDMYIFILLPLFLLILYIISK